MAAGIAGELFLMRWLKDDGGNRWGVVLGNRWGVVLDVLVKGWRRESLVRCSCSGR